MTRVDRFKENRLNKRKFIGLFTGFFIFLTSGVCVADYSVNDLIKNERKLGLANVKDTKSYLLEISILNRKFSISTFLIKRDYQRLKRLIKGDGSI